MMKIVFDVTWRTFFCCFDSVQFSVFVFNGGFWLIYHWINCTRVCMCVCVVGSACVCAYGWMNNCCIKYSVKFVCVCRNENISRVTIKTKIVFICYENVCSCRLVHRSYNIWNGPFVAMQHSHLHPTDNRITDLILFFAHIYCIQFIRNWYTCIHFNLYQHQKQCSS